MSQYIKEIWIFTNTLNAKDAKAVHEYILSQYERTPPYWIFVLIIVMLCLITWGSRPKRVHS